MSENNSPKTDSAQQEKLEKQERMRKNIRVIALCLAAYYFISAGFEWYEESQAKERMLNQEISTVFENTAVLSGNTEKALALFRNNGAVFAALGADGTLTSSDGTAAISTDADSQKVRSVTFSAHYDKTLSHDAFALIKTFISSIENTNDTKAVEGMSRRIGFDDQAEQLTFKEGNWTTAKANYALTVGNADGKNTVTVKAQPVSEVPGVSAP